MNKNILLLPVALLTTALVSCNEEVKPAPKTFENAIKELDNGFKLVGVVHQARTPLGMAPNGVMMPIGQTEEQGYNVEYTFENGERKAVHKVTYALGELENLLYYCDEDGYAYTESFNYKNEVVKSYQLNNGDKIPFANSGFYNPFSVFNKEDFRYNDKYKRYDLNLDKTSIILNNLMYSVNSGFFGLPIRSSIKFANEKLMQFDVTMDSKVSFEKVSQTQVMPYKYDNDVTFTFEDIGSAKVSRIKPFEDKKENDVLKEAFDSVDNNLTMLVETKKSVNGGTPSAEYQQFKFDGNKILVQEFEKPINGGKDNPINVEEDFLLQKIDESDLLFSHTYNETNKTWERNVSKNFAQLFQNKFYYEDYLPVVKGVSEDLFEYDSEKDEYVTKDPMVVNALKGCFCINKAPFISSDIDNAHQIGIRLTSDNQIDYVRFYYSYFDLLSSNQNVYSGYIKINYRDIGKTEVK